MNTKIKPGMVVPLQNGWTFTLIVNNKEKVSRRSFNSCSEAKAAQRYALSVINSCVRNKSGAG